MKSAVLLLTLALQVGPLIAEGPLEYSSPARDSSSSESEAAVTLPSARNPRLPTRAFTRAASIGSISSLGTQFQLATNLNSHMDVRLGFNSLVWKRWITYRGFTAPANLNLISSSTTIDIYPSPKRGFRLSPGILVHNSVAGSSSIQIGPSGSGQFTLNGNTYYSTSTPIADLNPFTPAPGPEPPKIIEQLHLSNPAFTMTTGWNNVIPRMKATGWTFPFEAGVAFLGSPSVNTAWVQGRICDAQFENCHDAASDAQFRSDVKAHFSTYTSRLNISKTYPII